MTAGTILSLASDAAGLGLNLAKLIGNAHKVKTETAELASLKQPLYQIQNEFFQNKNIAEAEAGGGLPQTVKDTLDKQRRTGLGTSISAMLQSGALPGDISKLFDIYDQSISTDAARDSEAHRQNIQMYMDAAKDLAGQKTTAWAVNEYQPYKEKLNQLTQNLATSKTNVQSAIQGIIGSIGAAGTALSLQDLISAPSLGGKSTATNPLTRETAAAPIISFEAGLPTLAERATPDIGLSDTQLQNLFKYLNRPQ